MTYCACSSKRIQKQYRQQKLLPPKKINLSITQHLYLTKHAFALSKY
ncbi:hypothetical protein XNC1_0965 [Xenorhabdus nematophila ATCC 19061]|uniref:Uncharacterized protein n=1 Tax=Xenorhabdus nematophila (strain ATCC 19061 / DSM 3370 / CCUG 14189 / LMG 1036 / NCIMB 9965 / AN6) TaxID=406817 RepID=D3VL77_XENNA|nr:hypothetical protein XNC1_0965 [Xenorhabdus nematophila ATCC 19061]